MKHIKLFIVATLATLMAFSVGSLFAKFDENVSPLAFYLSQGKTENVVVAYHERMNDLFNAKSELLIEQYGKKAVDVAPTGEEQCTAENTSTYCVAEAAVDEYFAFQEVMFSKRQEFEFPDTPENGEVSGKSLITELSGLQTDRLVFINEELDIAFETMDLALKSYNELHRAYPLHKQYEALIKELEQYRDMISEVRHQVEFFPGKFIDVSTTQCN